MTEEFSATNILKQLERERRREFNKFQKCAACGYEQKVRPKDLDNDFIRKNRYTVNDENTRNGVFPFIVVLDESIQLIACPVCGTVKANLNTFDRFGTEIGKRERKEELDFLDELVRLGGDF